MSQVGGFVHREQLRLGVGVTPARGTVRTPSNLSVEAVMGIQQSFAAPFAQAVHGSSGHNGWDGWGLRGGQHVQPHGVYGISRARATLERAADSTKAQDLPGPSTSFMYFLVGCAPKSKGQAVAGFW